MLLLLAAATTSVPYGTGLVVSSAGEVVAGIVTASILGTFAYIVRQDKIRKDTEMKRDIARSEADKKRDEQLTAITGALITPAPTPLDPSPSPRLIEVVMGKDGQGGLVKESREQRLILDQLVRGQIRAARKTEIATTADDLKHA